MQAGEIYRTGDFIVKDNETYVIENVTFFIDGNVIIKDSATLIVRNAKLIVNNTYRLRYIVKVLDKATLKVENSTLTSAPLPSVQLWVRTYERPGAKIVMFNTKCDWELFAMGGNTTIDSSSLSSLFWRAYWKSKVSVTNSSLLYVGLSFGKSDEDIWITGLKPHVKLEKVRIEAEGGSLEMRKVSVEEWVIDLIRILDLDSKLHITINDSHIYSLQFWAMEDAYIKFNDLKPGMFMNWNIRQNVQGLGPWSNLTLVKTRVDTLRLHTKSKIEVENMEGVRIHTSLNASVVIKNSEVIDLHLLGNDFIKLMNTTITGTFWIGPVDTVQYADRGPVEIEDAHVIEFFNSRISGAHIQVASRYTLMRGNISVFYMSMDRVDWAFGTIDREYPLIMRDGSGNPLPNASLILSDPNSKLIWNGTTDQRGRAVFNIRFTKENYSKEWILKVTINSMNITKEIGFLTSTPIILTLPKLPSSISLSASSNKNSLGESITIFGSISPPHEATVVLKYKMPNGTILTKNITSTVSGKFEDTFTPNIVGSWIVRASWNGDLDHEGAESREFSFSVLKARSSLSLLASRENIREGEEITISGSINPPSAGIALSLTFERPMARPLLRSFSQILMGPSAIT